MSDAVIPFSPLASKNGLSVRLQQQHPITLDMQWHCAPGELLALVGPSGAGKTTALRHIAGLATGPRGRIVCGDHIWFDDQLGIALSPQQRRVGLVFQQYALFPHLSALHNIALAVSERSIAIKRANELLAAMHLDGLGDRLPHELSGGQQQRVALARALAREPQALLLDEPFSATDQLTRQALYQELALLRRSLAMPIILVTHDLAEARMLADTMVIVDHGRSLQQGAPERVLARPRTARVAELVGIRNVFDGVFHRATASAPARIVWGESVSLTVDDKGRINDHQAVTWVIAGAYLSLAAIDATGDNLLAGEVTALLPLGDITQTTVRIDQVANAAVVLNMPTQLLKARALSVGAAVRVHFDQPGIHVMPIHVSQASVSS